MTQTTAPSPGRHGRHAARFDQPLFDRSAVSPQAAGPDPDDAADGVHGCLFALGERPSFLQTAEDVARASGRRFRPVLSPDRGGYGRRSRSRSAPVLPVFGAGDALVLETEAVPDLLAGLERSLHARPPGAVVVVGHEGGTDPWRAAGALTDWVPRPEVVQFPQGRGWLADRLSPVAARSGRKPVIGVVGACGGIGTSTLALWLAARAAEDGHATAVVDAAGSGAGLDACLQPGTAAGLRWEELGRLPAMPGAGDLLSALPAPHGLPVLTSSAAGSPDAGDSWGTHGPSAEAVFRGSAEPVHDQWAATEALSEVVVPVVDLGTAHALAGAHRIESQWIPRCSALVLLVPFTLRGLCQARSAVAQWTPLAPVLPVGVGPRVCDVSTAEAGAAVGAPLRAVVPPVGAVCEASEAGRLLEAGYRRSLRRPIAQTLAAVLEAIGPGSGSGTDGEAVGRSRSGSGIGRPVRRTAGARR